TITMEAGEQDPCHGNGIVCEWWLRTSTGHKYQFAPVAKSCKSAPGALASTSSGGIGNPIIPGRRPGPRHKEPVPSGLRRKGTCAVHPDLERIPRAPLYLVDHGYHDHRPGPWSGVAYFGGGDKYSAGRGHVRADDLGHGRHLWSGVRGHDVRRRTRI